MDPESTIAHYGITAKIGEGGMGTVYRATDTKLNREVAIKVLPDAFAQDPDRMARFAREAQVLASLNHPNIATIFGVEERALVMELVEGETLAGPMPMDEALPLARQIAEALEYAHERGVIHRDLKPANVKVTSEGRVKLLDFGLAKALAGDFASGDPAASPTLTMRATVAGTIMGTAAYMSPEQARGKAVDRRADIWAFGVVLYEMLTGRRLFEGETVSDTLAGVLKADPDWSALPAGTPPGVRRLLRRCLERDLGRRLPNIGVARLELEEREPPATPAPVAPAKRSPWLWPAVAAAALLGAAVLAFVHFQEAAPEPPIVRFQLALPEKTIFNGHVAVSPDGSRIAVSASRTDGRSLIWIRDFDRLDWQPLAGTENGGYFFWSPDSRSLAFFADDRLKRVDAHGGPIQTICEANVVLNGDWNREGIILFGKPSGELFRVPASGGTATPASVRNPQLQTNHSHPVFLPDGRHVLYHAQSVKPGDSGIYVARLRGDGTLEPGTRVILAATGARYLPGPKGVGQILFVRAETLMAQPFDETRLQASGDPYPVADRTGSFLTRPYFGISKTGNLAYWTGGNTSTELVWFDRKGNRMAPPLKAAFGEVALSPDARHAATTQRRQAVAAYDVSVIDLDRGTSLRIPADPVGSGSPIWAPDGKRLAFSTANFTEIHVRLATGTGAEEVLNGLPAARAIPSDWSRDGKLLLFESGSANPDLWIHPMGAGKPYPYLNSAAQETQGHFSPDAKFVAYTSNETGISQVYVQEFPPSGGKWQISTAGGSQPRWRIDGSEIFYVDPDRNLMAVSVTKGPGFHVSAPQKLFNTTMYMAVMRPGIYRYDIRSDGQRFLVSTMDQATVAGELNVVLNWRPGK